MEAEKKLRGAKYHLQRMKEKYLINEEIFTYELEAFLSKTRSIPDVLLEDFNQKFSLGISLEEKLYPETFEKRARELKNVQAINFIDWWKGKMNQIQSDPLGAILFKKRNISIHRKVVKPNHVKVTVHETIHLTDSVIVKKYDERGKLIEEVKSPETPEKPPEPKPAEINWFFSEYPNEDVLEACKKLLEMMKEFIQEAKNKFN